MDRRLLDHYNNELHHLRATATEFANEFPKIAGRLALDRGDKDLCADPFVERLLEGFAFLTARIQVKFDAEFPRFSQSLIETVYPQYLSPVPSMTVVRFSPDEQATQLGEGFVIPRGTSLRSNLGRNDRTACEYRTAHQVKLWPIRLVEAQYYTRDVNQLGLPGDLGARAAIRLRLRTTHGKPFNSLKLNELPLFLRGSDEIPVSIYEQIFSRGKRVIVQANTNTHEKPRFTLPVQTLRRVGFREDEALLPPAPRGFEGYRLLREYFSFPQRFQFFEFGGLQPVLSQCDTAEVDLIIPLAEAETRLEGRIDASSFELFCTPAINLFSKRVDHILLSEKQSEFHVVPDRTKPWDFEVFQIDSVTAYGSRSGEEQPFRPFYRSHDTDHAAGAFYTMNRTPRVLAEKERKFGQVSSYVGTEVYLSLVDSQAAPYSSDLQQLGVIALCTNRHLPLTMAIGGGRTDFSMEINAPIGEIRVLSGPTAPRPPHPEGEVTWRMISHLSLNYLSLLDSPDGEGASALREILKLYVERSETQMARQIAGLRSAHSKPIIRRVETSGPITFARGIEITTEFDESHFEGSGVFILGAVLENFFSRYVSLNSFTETVIRSQQRGEIMRWKPQIGKRQLI
ncbi:type VI secretion protein, VC_A0110 family [Chthoniobacter flavus Ellin428]|uniref:Type VI secretion protein, VC_A0110 family n=1 Tax=Chthoniobacter flavus Ellin428 TaxID=497964 RepID=B4D1Q2_9BACT|nr:type VI secretion system baseplate subunit TssF [Chthoniobacter flavus]EDY19664.1 type VI secretion protein, VC_A0110 family [Chthoniobacter flavus Ellin428]TCO92900.1 type VI secretion system protein ImpG [Chthoniobacter flavus]